MTPEQAHTLTVGMSVIVPVPFFRGYDKVGEAHVLAKIGARYECAPALSAEHGGQYLRPTKRHPVDGYGYFWAEHHDGINRQPRRLLVHVSEAEAAVGVAGATA